VSETSGTRQGNPHARSSRPSRVLCPRPPSDCCWSTMASGISPPYDIPPEECVLLVCSYINSLILAAASTPPPSTPPPLIQDPLATPPEDAHRPCNASEDECPPPAQPRRSLDYVAERPNGAVSHVLGEEFGIGVGYAELVLAHQKQRLAKRFTSKEVPKISILDYLERYSLPLRSSP
jgi:hypothetical protein